MRSLPPFLKILPLVIVGILLAEAIDMPWWVAAIGGGVCSFITFVPQPRTLSQLYITFAIVLWSMAVALLRQPYNASEPSGPTLHQAHITTTPHTSGRWQRCDAEIVLQGRKRELLLYADTSVTISLGERGYLRGYLNPLPEGGYGSLMNRRGYVGRLYVTKEADWQPYDTLQTPAIIAQRARHSLIQRLERLEMGSDERAVVEAMLLGERRGITPALREDYSRAGGSHLLAISGLHVGIVAMVIWWLTWFIPLVGRRGHIWRNIVAALIMLLYAAVTGLSPSVIRATIMFLTAQMALAYGTLKSALNLLFGAATIMLLINPNNLFDISFLLSFIAVGGIAIGYEPAREFFALPGRGPQKALMGVVIIGICSTLATLPLVAYTFSVVSLVGIFLNPIVILTAQIIVLGGLIWVTLPLEVLRPVAEWIVGGAARVQNSVVREAASLPWAAIDVELPRWIMLLGYLLLAVGVIVAALWKEKKRWSVEEKS